MSIPGLPRGKRSQVFRAVEAILKADPVLSAVVKTWVSFDGSADAATTPPDLPPSSVEPPFPDLCPYVALALIPQRVVLADSATYGLVGAVGLTIATAGEYADDHADLQEAAIAALSRAKVAFPLTDPDITVADYLNNRSVADSGGNPLPAQGASEWYFTDFKLRPISDGEVAMLVSDGALAFTVRVPR